MDRRQFLLWPMALTLTDMVARAGIVPAPHVVAHYAQLVYASYRESLAQAAILRLSIHRLLSSPTEATLSAARRAWLQAREWYGQTEAFRFYGGPIDGIEARLNAWPIDESYIDHVVSLPRAGLINDRRVRLSKAVLSALNERNGEANICTGWHAIEFLLWGQDLDVDGPGRRPATDFSRSGRANADRRCRYLLLVADMLVEDLDSLVQAWRPGTNNFRAGFVSHPHSLGHIFLGLGTFSRAELAGERLEVAMDTRDQEDEHSCFSDNTHRDFVAGLQGVCNVWRGEFIDATGQRLLGPSPRALVAETAIQAADALDTAIHEAQEAALAIQPPFDQEIAGPDNGPGRLRLVRLRLTLHRQASALAEAAASLGLRGLISPSR